MKKKPEKLVIPAPKKRHKELFSGAAKPKVGPSDKKVYERKPKHQNKEDT